MSDLSLKSLNDSKLDINSITTSTTNGNIKVNGTETKVYIHPSTHDANMITGLANIATSGQSTDILFSSSNFTSTNVKAALDELFTNVSNGKTIIATAITDKGVPTSSNDNFSVMANNISLIKNKPIINDTYTPPSDWINIDNPADGQINLLVNDTAMATYAFICTTTSGQYQINWGDGTTTLHDSGTIAQHTYTIGSGQPCSRGYTTFKIVITSVDNCLLTFKVTNHNLASNTQYHGILGCTMNCSTLTSLANAFYQATPIYVFSNSLEFYKGINTNSLTDMSYMFYSCYALQSINISSMINITNTSYMFYACYNLQSVDVSNMVNATNTSYMFYGCYSLQSINISNMINVTNAISMFSGCYNLQSIDVSSMTNVITATGMFSTCYNLQSLDVSNMANITNAQSMFSNCYGLQSINIGNMANLITAQSMFSGCRSLKSIDVSSMINVTNAQSMFSGCFSLQFIDVSSMTSVTNASAMFNSCYTLPSVNISNMTNVTNAISMFSSCYVLQSIDVSHMTNVTDTSSMFYGCYNLQSINISNMINVTNAQYMFYSCYSLQSLSANNFSLNVASVNMSYTFTQCEQLRNISLPNAKLLAISINGISGKLNNLQTLTLNSVSTFSGTSPQIDISYNNLTNTQLDAIFTALPTVTSKTINITGCTGVLTCTRSIATNKGWTVAG